MDILGLKSSAATNIYGGGLGTVDVVHDYRWTLSPPKNFDEVPYVTLTEYEIDESSIVTQLSYYASAAYKATSRNTDMLGPYQNLFPRTSTGNIYVLPYFSDVNFEINTPVWKSLDTLGELGNAVQSGIGALFGEKAGKFAGQIGGAIAGAAGVGLTTAYPKVGIMDRPRLWESHEFRTTTIKFPLFNTYNATDWERNRQLCWLLTNSNLYTKRDFITSIPPVYYELEVPGQHYSYASCVTNLVVYNRGNSRMLNGSDGKPAIVPDAYEVNITLTDMVMPSRNLFQSINNPKVNSSTPDEERFNRDVQERFKIDQETQQTP